MARAEGTRLACAKCGSEIVYTKACECTEGRHEEICCGEQMKEVDG
ncbi:MAG: hypothetical protein Q4F67_08585 [Propionibacteriaceae bacterium]|nr:hypothetical protein [Propionibacteriaceae bacterium]